MSSLAKNLLQLMKDAGIGERELARKTGVAQSIIHRIVSGENSNPKLDSLKPLANFFLVTLSQLIGEDDLPATKLTGKFNMIHDGWREVPLLSWKEAQRWPDSKEMILTRKSLKFILTDVEISDIAFALKIQETSMEPKFMEGTIIVIDPLKPTKDKSYVLYYLHEKEEVVLKQFLIDNKVNYLRSININLGMVKAIKIKQEDRFIGTVVHARQDF